MRSIITGVAENFETIHGKLRNCLTNRNKKDAWESIAATVNALGVCPQTVDELKVKWKDLKAKATTDHILITEAGNTHLLVEA